MPFGLGLVLGLAEDCFAPCAVSYTHLDVYKRQLQDTPQAAADKLEALGVINSPDYWAEAAEAGKVQYLDILLKKAAQTITKAGVRTDTPCLLYTSRCV